MWGYSSLWFRSAILWRLTMLSIFLCTFWPSACLLWKTVYSGLLLILIKLFVFWCGVIWLSTYFGYLSLIGHIICKYFLPLISSLSFLFLSLFVCLFCFFRAAPMANGSSQLGGESELHLPAYTTATQCWIFTHWARPGIEPVFSWVLARFTSAAPPWNSPGCVFILFLVSFAV